MAELVIGKDEKGRVILPPDAVTQRNALLGRIGSGKTYASMKLAELMHGAGGQIVPIDPVGVWWGLRLAKDGKSKGIEIPVFGGLHGDIPLTHTSGALIADLIVDRRLSVVLDVSQFASDRQKATFAEDFAERFFRRMQSAPAPVHIFLEECQEFVPQNTQKGEEMMLHHWTRMAKLGRNYGIGLSLISQRPQEVNKKVLNLSELLFAFQMTGVQERKTVREWLDSKGVDVFQEKDEDVRDVLRRLPVGTCVLSSPQWLQYDGVVKIDQRWTYDASSTPSFAKGKVERKELAPLDLGELQKAMAATVEKIAANDPKKLNVRIRELEAELEKVQGGLTDADVEERIMEAVREEQQEGRRVARELMGQVRVLATAIQEEAQRLLTMVAEEEMRAVPSEPARPARPVRFMREPMPATDAAIARAGARGVDQMKKDLDRQIHGNGTLGKGERIVLTAVTQYEGTGVDREQLTVLTGYKKSSRDTYLQRLFAAGHVELNRNNFIVATGRGVRELGEYERLPVGDELREFWLGRLGGGEQVILQVVSEAYPNPIDRTEIEQRTGYKKSSRDTYIQRLVARKLVVIAGKGQVIASDNLFGGRRR